MPEGLPRFRRFCRGRSPGRHGRLTQQPARRACRLSTFCFAATARPPSRQTLDRWPTQMKREILINANPRETRVAILEDDQLVELLVDRPDARRMVGDIYLGRVDAVLPGIQAAFVDIGTEKSAFLHASDLVFPENEPSD